MAEYEIKQGDALSVLRSIPADSVQCCVTSPPYYGLRDYGVAGQIGLEQTPAEYVAKLVEVFEEVRRVLKADGTAWVNLGDSYGGTAGNTRGNGAGGGQSRGEAMFGNAIGRDKGGKPKDLMGIPWRVAFALQDAGWWLRQDIIWSKPNPMPESVTDRCTKAHEYIFLLTKSAKYFYDGEAIKETSARPEMVGRPNGHNFGTVKGTAPGQSEHSNYGTAIAYAENRNKRSVWTVTTQPYSEAHFATFPPKLIEPMILAGSREGDTVLDPFNGSGTTGLVSLRHKRNYVGIELNESYIAISEKRLRDVQINLF